MHSVGSSVTSSIKSAFLNRSNSRSTFLLQWNGIRLAFCATGGTVLSLCSFQTPLKNIHNLKLSDAARRAISKNNFTKARTETHCGKVCA